MRAAKHGRERACFFRLIYVPRARRRVREQDTRFVSYLVTATGGASSSPRIAVRSLRIRALSRRRAPAAGGPPRRTAAAPPDRAGAPSAAAARPACRACRPASTGITAWPRIGPQSSSGVTSCTVQPCTAIPAASARAWVSRPGKERQDRGMDVEHPSRPGGDEPRRQHPHEAREADDLGAALAERPHHRRLERRPVAAEGAVVDRRRRHPQLRRPGEPAGVRPVRDDEAGLAPDGPASAMSRASASMFEPPPEIRIATRRRLTGCPSSARRRRATRGRSASASPPPRENAAASASPARAPPPRPCRSRS